MRNNRLFKRILVVIFFGIFALTSVWAENGAASNASKSAVSGKQKGPSGDVSSKPADPIQNNLQMKPTTNSQPANSTASQPAPQSANGSAPLAPGASAAPPASAGASAAPASAGTSAAVTAPTTQAVPPTGSNQPPSTAKSDVQVKTASTAQPSAQGEDVFFGAPETANQAPIEPGKK